MYEKAGYQLYPFITGFITTSAEPVPQISTSLSFRDHVGTIGARSGFFRNTYKITPGLYALGSPSPESPVIVTANYKLTFDTVRSALSSLNLWLLVVDTRGINVWCAAGKSTFSTDEVSYQVLRSRLAEIVSHRNLILPQLAAVGVAAMQLKRKCGFHGIFGPVRIADLPAFLNNDMHADEAMRSVTFSLGERLVLVPVEVLLIYKPLIIALLAVTLLSGFGPGIYSATAAVSRGGQFLTATLVALLAGAVITPACLPWIPGRQFWLKGLQPSCVGALYLATHFQSSLGTVSILALMAWTLAAGSYLAMNFTGSTPYTSLAGVEIEMRRGLVVQIALSVIAFLLWLAAPFF